MNQAIRRTFEIGIYIIVMALFMGAVLFYNQRTEEELLKKIDRRVTNVEQEILNAVNQGPENTLRALCAIFETFDRLADYHGFPPATDAETRAACAALEEQETKK